MPQSYSKFRERNGRRRKNAGLRILTVRQRPGRPSQGLLQAGGTVFRCALGKGGVSARKREGDGATPLGRMPLVSGYFRGDHVAARRTRLPMTPISARLGWCEVPDDRNYNRPVRLPYPVSHEHMLRPDRLYDICIVLNYNHRPRRRGAGSAIFLHIARPGYLPTEGCVAVSLATMKRLLPLLSPRTVLRVVR